MSLVKEITVTIDCANNGYYIRWYSDGWHYWYFRSGGEVYNTKGAVYSTDGYTSLQVGDNVTSTELLAIRGILAAKFIELYTDDGWKPATLNDETWQLGRADRNGQPISFVITVWLKGSALAPVEPVDESELFAWINDSCDRFVNSDGIKMVFKRIA